MFRKDRKKIRSFFTKLTQDSRRIEAEGPKKRKNETLVMFRKDRKKIRSFFTKLTKDSRRIEAEGTKKRKNETLVTFREKKIKKKLSFVAKLTQISTAETQLNPTKKTRRNISKRFLKKI